MTLICANVYLCVWGNCVVWNTIAGDFGSIEIKCVYCACIFQMGKYYTHFSTEQKHIHTTSNRYTHAHTHIRVNERGIAIRLYPTTKYKTRIHREG